MVQVQLNLSLAGLNTEHPTQATQRPEPPKPVAPIKKPAHQPKGL
jgi:hypothetical protein